ncbi:MAG: tetratricopeptide repeat protein [Myxococcota bacterium]
MSRTCSQPIVAAVFSVCFSGVAAFGCGHAQEPQELPPADPIMEVEASELFQQGIQLAQSGDLIRAEQYIAASVVRGFPEEQALPVLLRVCISASRLRVALGYAQPYLEEHPDDWSLRYLVASIYLGMGQIDRAQEELQQVLEDAPEEADPYFLMAVVLRDERGEIEAADDHFRRYLELAPDGARAPAAQNALRRVPIPRSTSGSVDDSSSAGSTLDGAANGSSTVPERLGREPSESEGEGGAER